MRMILEIRFLGIRVVLDPKTVEALLAFITLVAGYPSDEQSASSDSKTLE